MAEKNPAFAVKPDDPKDVSWGLTTADACWKRGERGDALKWLRKAVEAASEAECDERALELAKVAADLATQIGSMAPPPPAAPAPAAIPVAPRPLAARFASGTPPRPAVGSPAVRAPQVKEATKKERKSITNEGPKSRSSQVDKAEKAEKAEKTALLDKTQDDRPAHPFAEVPPPRKRSNSKADKTEKAEKAEVRKPSRADEIDAWPTEVVAGHDLPVPDVGAQTDMSIPKPSGVVRSTQAVRVLVWKHADGSVRIAAVASGRVVPSDAVEATLAALDVRADLVALLS
jgi:hypothetical protein